MENKDIQKCAFGSRDANLKCADFTVNSPGRKEGHSNGQQTFLDVIPC